MLAASLSPIAASASAGVRVVPGGAPRISDGVGPAGPPSPSPPMLPATELMASLMLSRTSWGGTEYHWPRVISPMSCSARSLMYVTWKPAEPASVVVFSTRTLPTPMLGIASSARVMSAGVGAL